MCHIAILLRCYLWHVTYSYCWLVTLFAVMLFLTCYNCSGVACLCQNCSHVIWDTFVTCSPAVSFLWYGVICIRLIVIRYDFPQGFCDDYSVNTNSLLTGVLFHIVYRCIIMIIPNQVLSMIMLENNGLLHQSFGSSRLPISILSSNISCFHLIQPMLLFKKEC